jgi:hypothetical protein
MAINFTSVADMIDIPLFTEATLQSPTNRNDSFLASNAIRVTEVFPKNLGNATYNSIFFNAPADDADVLDDEHDLTDKKLTTETEVGVVRQRGQAFGASNLAGVKAGEDLVGVLASRVVDYWAEQYTKDAGSHIKGLFAADQAAGVSGVAVMSYDATIDGVGGTAFSFDNWLELNKLAGDTRSRFTSILMHSEVAASLEKLNEIEFRPTSEGGELRTWRGKELIVDDFAAEALTDGSGNYYLSVALQPGAIAFDVMPDSGIVAGSALLGSGWRNTAFEVKERTGAGVTSLLTRRMYSFHVPGTNWENDTMAKGTPTNAELALAANWSLRHNTAKRYPMLIMKHT